MRTIRVVLAGAVVIFSSAAQASLIGDTASCNFNSATNSLICSTPTAVVGPGSEFTLNLVPGGTPRFDINIGASSIGIGLLGGGITTFGSATQILTLASLDDDSGGDIVGIANFAPTGTTGVTASDVSFTAHSVSFNFSNSGWVDTASASFDLVIGRVPEPMSLALLATGLAALGFTRRRRQS